MKQKILIRNGRVIDPLNKIDGYYDVYIAEGKIQAIVEPLADFEPDVILDARSQIVCPGFVDLGANILESVQGYDQFQAYLRQALFSGITSLVTRASTPMRCLETSEILYFRSLSGASNQSAKIYFIGPLTKHYKGDRLAELVLLHEAGCIGFTNGISSVESPLVKRRCYDYAASFQFKIFIYPQENSLTPKGGMHEGEISACFGLPVIPALAETFSLSQELALIEATNIDAHFFSLSSSQSMPLLREARRKGLSVSAGVSIAHLFLTEKDISLDSGFGNVLPPLRRMQDRLSLREGIKEDLLLSIGSDHTVLPKQVKAVPFQDSEPGLASWPFFLPLALRLADEEDLALSKILAAITYKPAGILGIDAGHLTPGHSADLIIFDLNAVKEISQKPLKDICLPKEESQGYVEYVLVDGEIIVTP